MASGPSQPRPPKRICTERALELLEMDENLPSELSEDSENSGESSCDDYDTSSSSEDESESSFSRSNEESSSSIVLPSTVARSGGGMAIDTPRSTSRARSTVGTSSNASTVAGRCARANVRGGPERECRWERVTTGETQLNFRFVGSDSHGVNTALCSADSSELDCLFILLTPELLDSLIRNINAYGEKRRMLNTPLREHSSFRRMDAITRPELLNFFAILIAMGMDSRHDMKAYWSIQKEHRHTPWYGKRMARPRFEMIYHTMLHAGGEDAEAKEKIEPFLETLMKNFQAVFYPNRELAIDEMVIGYKGRWKHRQFNVSKPSKYHIKTFGVCDSETGYVYNLFTYYGAKTSYHPDLDPPCAQAIKVFDKLLSPLQTGHHIFGDRFYSSIPLVDFLCQRSFHYTGTIDARRKHLPPQIKTLKLKQNQMVWFLEENQHYLVVSFRDKKEKKFCSLLTTNGNVSTTTVEQRRGTVEKPAPIQRYNENMNGCDRADQQVNYYGMHKRKSHKWWKKIFFWLLELSQVNASILFDLTRVRDNKYKRLPLSDFKDNLIFQLTHAAGTVDMLPRRPVAVNTLQRIDLNSHFMESADKDRNCSLQSSRQKKMYSERLLSVSRETPPMYKELLQIVAHKNKVLDISRNIVKEEKW